VINAWAFLNYLGARARAAPQSLHLWLAGSKQLLDHVAIGVKIKATWVAYRILYH